MNGSGEMQTGWQAVGGKWYYLDPTGAMKHWLAAVRRPVVLSEWQW